MGDRKREGERGKGKEVERERARPSLRSFPFAEKITGCAVSGERLQEYGRHFHSSSLSVHLNDAHFSRPVNGAVRDTVGCERARVSARSAVQIHSPLSAGGEHSAYFFSTMRRECL